MFSTGQLPTLVGMGRVVRFLSVLLVVLFVASASAVGRVSSAQAAPSFALYGCSSDPGGFAKLDSFQHSFREVQLDLLPQVETAMYKVLDDVNAAYDESKQNTARMIEDATAALADVSVYRSKLDALGLGFDAMQRASHVTAKRGVASLIESGLGQIDAGISKLYQAGDVWEAAGKAILAYQYDEALNQLESAANAYNDAHTAIYAGFSLIVSAIAAVEAAFPCTDADAAAPMSATQINRATGGTGTQHGGGGEFSIVAPKRLKLRRHGPTTLPMTLQASTHGQIELWLSRGNKSIIEIQAWAFRPCKFGLKIDVPHGAAHGNLKLRLAFISGDAFNPTTTINLSVPLH